MPITLSMDVEPLVDTFPDRSLTEEAPESVLPEDPEDAVEVVDAVDAEDPEDAEDVADPEEEDALPHPASDMTHAAQRIEVKMCFLFFICLSSFRQTNDTKDT